MITNANIEEIIKKVKDELNKQVTLRDIMFILNQGMFEDRKTAYKASFGEIISDNDLDIYIYSQIKVKEQRESIFKLFMLTMFSIVAN